MPTDTRPYGGRYASLSDMPTDVIQLNLAWAKRMMKAWGPGDATDNLLDIVNDWKRELERRASGK